MPTQSISEPIVFARLHRRDVVADFGGRAITSDVGAPLLWAPPRPSGWSIVLPRAFATTARPAGWS